MSNSRTLPRMGEYHVQIDVCIYAMDSERAAALVSDIASRISASIDPITGKLPEAAAREVAELYNSGYVTIIPLMDATVN